MPASRRQLPGAIVMLLGGFAMTGGGVFEVVVQLTGPPAMARITDCQEHIGRYHNVTCNGTWTTGQLVKGHGHVVTGIIDGATEADIGQTLAVHLAGGRAYVPTVRIPLLLLAFGLAMVAYGISLLHAIKRASQQGSLRGFRHP